jgi:hypothetical protein
VHDLHPEQLLEIPARAVELGREEFDPAQMGDVLDSFGHGRLSL